MTYNFDEIIDRTNTNSVKFDLREQLFGRKDIIPMWVADMDFKTPDFIVDIVKKRAEHEIFGYSYRSDSYFDALINWVKRRHNWKINKEWIAFSPGVVPAVNMAIQAFTKLNDGIIIQPPVYFPFFSAIENNNRKVLTNPLKLENGRYNINFDDLAEKAPKAKMIIISNPHNPGGSVWTKKELTKLANICIKNNVLIISDEIHCDLVYRNYKYTPIASINNEIANNTLSFLAASKTFNIAGLATASVVCSNNSLLQRYNNIVEQIHIGSGNVFGSIASEAAYNNGDIWLDELLQYLSNNITYAEKFIKKNIPGISLIKPEGTYLIWLDCRKLNLDQNCLKDFFINEAGIGLNDGLAFGIEGEGFMRMNIACPKEILVKALNQIKLAVENLKN